MGVATMYSVPALRPPLIRVDAMLSKPSSRSSLIRQGILSQARLSLLVVFILLCGLHGCVSTPPKPLSGQVPATIVGEADQATALLAEAARLRPPASYPLELRAAHLLWQTADTSIEQKNHAASLLMNMDASKLGDEDFGLWTLLYARWALEKQQGELVRQLLENERIENLLGDLDNDLTSDLMELRANYFSADLRPQQAIEERMALISLTGDKHRREQQQSMLWAALRQLNADDLAQIVARQRNKSAGAWVELTRIATAQELDIDAQARQLEEWLDRYPQHPAAEQLPPELALLKHAIKNRPQRVTLLLPLSGNLQKAGEAVRDGFMAAYFQAMQRGYPLPSVRVIDSSGDNFPDTYDRAASDTDLVIGPLEKEKVAHLQGRWRLPVPTLALNDAPAASNPGNLYLFSLNPEEEARQAAQEARKQLHTNALIIVPASEWGQRLTHAFTTEWMLQQGVILGTVQFDASKEDYSTVLQQALGIADSKNRRQWLRQWSSEQLEFEPRRREDIDVIFLAARPDAARQIKPLLAFHYAGQIPVYAISSIYSGQPDVERDADLDGIQLLVSPWLFEQSELRSAVEASLKPPANMQTLYALGADAWRLHARLPLLESDPAGRIRAYSGILGLDTNHRVTRQQLWATIDKGLLTNIPSPIQP